jgi:alcohol dehydrogenase class IV
MKSVPPVQGFARSGGTPSAAGHASARFVSPGRILSGRDAANGLGGELSSLGIHPTAGTVAVIVDAAVDSQGLAAPFLQSLERAEYAVRTLPPVAAEPTLDLVESALARMPDDDVCAVIGIGGGSAMDAAKLTALGSANHFDLTAPLQPGAALAPSPPLLLAPTTAGTGAEATAVAMLWQDGKKRVFVHDRLLPAVVVLDGDLLRNLPPQVTASSGLDAVCHAIESLLSTKRTALTAAHARAALEVLVPSLPVAFTGAANADLWDEMLRGAFQAGLALNASVVLGHSIAYTIASRSGLPHGVTCAMALPYCLAYSRAGSEFGLREVAALVSDGEPESVVDWITELNASMEIPASLEEVGIGAKDIPAMAAECVEVYPRPNSPVPLEQTAIERLLERFLTGDVERSWMEGDSR